MKKISFLLCFTLLACATEKKSNFPDELGKVFEAHGGIEKWKGMQTLSYEIPKDSTSEKHLIDLKRRRDKVETADYSMGFDGSEVWLKDENQLFKGNALFYHNLMFYFYAMPFVLADEGINYTKAADLTFEGKTYPGFKISYNAGVGASSDDEYFIYYNPDTYQMEWLGYTVTFFDNKKSDDVHWIRYNNWQEINGLLLPISLKWYDYENGLPTKLRNELPFSSVTISETPVDESLFVKPEGAEVVEK